MTWYQWNVVIITAIFILTVFIRIFIHKQILKRKALTVGTGKQGFKKFFEQISVFFLFIGALAIIGYSIYPITLYTIHPLVHVSIQITGTLLLVLSYFLMVVAFVHMGKSWRIGIDRNTQDTLVTNGVFAFARNPIFVSIDLYVLGIFAIFPDILFLVICVTVILSIHLQIKEEEQFLSHQYGDEYQSYKERTGRYITFGIIRL